LLPPFLAAKTMPTRQYTANIGKKISPTRIKKFEHIVQPRQFHHLSGTNTGFRKDFPYSNHFNQEKSCSSELICLFLNDGQSGSYHFVQQRQRSKNLPFTSFHSIFIKDFLDHLK